jgi:hypothetical protein
MELKTNLTKKFLNGSDGDQLISPSLLQFPYGIGGVDERTVSALANGLDLNSL